MTATTVDLKQMFEAGYQAALGTTVKCPAHCPAFNNAALNSSHEKYVALAKAWNDGFQKKVDEDVAALLASWENEQA